MTYTTPRTQWLLREPSASAAARLFCLPYSGCGASLYRRWPEITGDVDLCPVQLPGRENRLSEPTFTTYQQLASELADALTPYLDRPYGFFGHCSSCLIAYETSVQLIGRSHPPPRALFVSSQAAPQDGPSGPYLWADDAELTDMLTSMIAEMGGVPVPELIEMSLEILRADTEVNRRYVVPEPVALPVPVTAISWTQDTAVDRAAMQGWTACGPTTFHVLEGGRYHFSVGPRELLQLFATQLGR